MGDRAEIISLLTKDSIDERIHELITEKKEMSDYIVDGALTSNKRELIKFLMN
jgi:SNF2 family DNA or RNA helicase